MSFIKRFSTKILLAVEKFYLKSHGWIQVGPDTWDAPIDYSFKRRLGVRQGHAVNSQKQDLYQDLGTRSGRFSINAPNISNPPRPDISEVRSRLGIVKDKFGADKDN